MMEEKENVHDNEKQFIKTYMFVLLGASGGAEYSV